jgi:ferrous-iron efflux pump FieF
MSGAHHHHHGHSHHHGHAGGERAQLTSRAALASITMALFLVAIKTYASWDTGSVAMLGSLADTTLDFIASLVTFFGVRWAAMPADEEHRYGHGKAEALAALIQVILIAFSALGIAWRAFDRLRSGQPTEGLELGVGVSVIAMIATVALLGYQRYVIRKTGSVAIQTDHVHYQSDLLLNLSVIAALTLDQLLGWRLADPLFGFAIAGWLLYGAWSAASHSVDQLMDREWPDEEREAFLAAAAEYPELNGLHDLRTRTSGPTGSSSFMSGFRPTGPFARRMRKWMPSRRSCSTVSPAARSSSISIPKATPTGRAYCPST